MGYWAGCFCEWGVGDVLMGFGGVNGVGGEAGDVVCYLWGYDVVKLQVWVDLVLRGTFAIQHNSIHPHLPRLAIFTAGDLQDKL